MTTKKDDVLIKVEGLHKIYGDFHALNGIDEEIHRGEVVVIVGPSGSGKSTFLRSLNLLEVPDQGHIYFEGVDITDKHVDINKHRQKGIIPTRPANSCAAWRESRRGSRSTMLWSRRSRTCG